jgi:pyridoxal phosphate enzyme (YggS family)
MSKETYTAIKSQLPSNVRLVAVSKTNPAEEIKKLYDLGQRHFGENKVQELVEKYESLPKDIKWHQIGHLQSNKVKYIAPFIHLIHAIDSLKILKEINKQAIKNERIIPCLLQFHISIEESKFGLDFEEAKELLESKTFIEMRNISIEGVMGMASYTDNIDQVRDEFRNLESYFNVLKSHFFKYNNNFKEISMGMSSDFKIAIEEGSSMVRVGSSIFGSR